jgi:hypothetical protein
MKIRHKVFKSKFPESDITFVETAQEAIDILSKDLDWDLISLDHDLGGRIFVDSNDSNTGYQVAKFLVDKEIKGKIIIHSCNRNGAMNMKSLLPDALYKPLFWVGIK